MLTLPMLRTLALALPLALGLAGCTSDADKVSEHMAAAARYREARDLRSALVELQAALKVQPKNAELNQRIAEIYTGLARPERAAFYFGEAYRLDPTRIEAALAQAPAFYGSDPDAAEAIVNEILEKAPDSALAHARHAEVRLLRADTAGALSAALTATELDPQSVISHRVVAAVHRSMIRESHLLGQPADAQVYQAAIDACERAASLAEGQEGAGPWYDRMQQALIYADWREHEEQARAAIQDAFRMADEADDRSGRLTVTREARRMAAADQDPAFNRWVVERWVQVEPNAIRGWALLASMEAAEGRSGDAVWQRALAERPESMVLQAGYVRLLAEEGRMADARAHLDRLPASVAGGAEAIALRAELAIRERDVPAANRVLAELRSRHPGSPLTRLTEARIAVLDGRVNEALLTLRALSGQVERADVLRDLAQVEALAGNADAALAAADRAIALQASRSPNPYAVRMRMLARKRDWPGVLRSWREMRAQGFPIGVPLEALRIQALYETGREVPARRLLERAVSEPQPDLAMLLLYYEYEGVTHPERAQELLAGAARRMPLDQRVAGAQVMTELRAGRGEAALARLDEYDRRTGINSLPALRAQILWALGRQEEAEASARVAFSVKPRAEGTTQLLVEVLSARGKADEAVQLLEQSRSAGELVPADLWQLGRLYLARGDLDRSREFLEEAAKDASLLAARNDLAYVLALSGHDLDRAVELARAVKSAMPEDAAIADTLGFAYLKKGLFEPAISELRSAIELARVRGQQVADYHYHLGLALQGLGRSEEARQAFDDALRIEPGHQAAQQARAQVGAGADAS